MPEAPVGAQIAISNSMLGNALQQILLCDDILPGDAPSYQACKAIFLAHPLGGKMAEAPVRLAQSQDREISVAIEEAPKESLVEAFNEEWKAIEATTIILNVVAQSKVYGVASVAMLSKQTAPNEPIPLDEIWKQELSFNVLDPLNTSGSLVLDQDPNSMLFQKHGDVIVSGTRYHRSRTRTIMNGQSIYIAWTDSAFGYVGRSCYQRALYPLKSFIETMRTDDLVVRKSGVIILKQEQPGTIVDKVMKGFFGIKRALFKEASTNNVISIGLKEEASTFNMQNLDGAYNLARNNIIKNIATAEDMPAKLLTEESYVEGFGEGTEDAKRVAMWIDNLRIHMQPIYAWFDEIVQRRAWNPEFYKTIQRRFPEEYGDVSYKEAFYKWQKAFRAGWPSLLKEPPSEAAQVDDIKMKAVIAVVQVLAPLLDPANKVRLIDWCLDNLNVHEKLFEGAKLDIDTDALNAFLESQPSPGEGLEQQENAKPERPFSSHDSAAGGIAFLDRWMSQRAEVRRPNIARR